MPKLWLLSFAVVAAGFSSVAASASEIPTLLPGSRIVVAGTHIQCSLSSTSVTCTRAGGLTATISKPGTVHVARGSRTLFAAGRPVTIHVNGGFLPANASIYCHVYVSGVVTLLCSDVDPRGGIPNTHGFAISDNDVHVFRYDATRSLRAVKTFHHR